MQDLIKPLSPNPIGEDPRYHDDFIFIKAEIEKLSGANFREVIIKAKNLLLTYSKDLRIAVYLTLALTVEEGLPGFIEGLTLCELLMASFGDYLKCETINWLNQPRVINLLPHEITESQYEEIKKFNIDFIQRWVRDKKPAVPIIEVESTPEENIDDLTRKIIGLLNTSTLQAAYYARALRWGDLILPEDSVIPPPRAESIIQLKNAVESENCMELCEALFLEPGGVFWLDLQYYANHVVATQQTRNLIERFPELIDLHFSNGMPFANDETRVWLLNLMAHKEEKPNVIKKIRAKDLSSHLKQLKNMPAITMREKFEQQYAMAKACVQHKRYDMALALFQLLDEIILKHQLDEWEPELVLRIWEDYYDVIEIEIKKQEEINKINLLKNLQIRICQLDVLRGVRL